jgi:hypothetical protein
MPDSSNWHLTPYRSCLALEGRHENQLLLDEYRSLPRFSISLSSELGYLGSGVVSVNERLNLECQFARIEEKDCEARPYRRH